MDMKAYPVWPIPQELTLRDDILPLDQAVIVVPEQAGPLDLAPANLFADLASDEFGVALPIVRGKTPAGKLPIAFQIADRAGVGVTPPDLPGAEGYLLEVTAQGVSAFGRDARGALYAAATLIQLAVKQDDRVVLRGAKVRDWPYKPVRMVHLYLPGTDHLGYARRYMRDFLVRYKYNGIFVEIGGGVRLRQRPEMAVGWRRFVDELSAIGDTVPLYGEHVPLGPDRRFTASIHTHLSDGRYLEPDELRQLAEWARELQLDFVPEIQSLSHAYYLSAIYPEIAEQPHAVFPDAYCPENPRSYEILFDVMESYIALTGCSSVHIGHDEWRAGGLCPRCKTRDTSELFAEDVLRVTQWLTEREQGVWMWGDHLVPKHNGRGGSSDNGKVWYDYPQTRDAGKRLASVAPQITLLNWSWYLGENDGDKVLRDLGFRQILGNFDGFRFPNWPGRSSREGVLGAEVSSWCAWQDFELGLNHYPAAIHAANLMWSTHWPEKSDARELTARQMPGLRDRMRRLWEKPRLWSEATAPRRKHILSIQSAANAPLQTDIWDLSGIPTGPQEYDALPYEIGPAVVVAERLHATASHYPHQSAPITVGGEYASLIFWQAADREGTSPMHAGDGTHHPREAAELLGWYEIRFADGLTRQAEIRYAQNILEWDHSFGSLYHAREIRAGQLPDGRPMVVWGLEWTNPRPHIAIESVTLQGSRGLPHTRPENQVSDARPILLGITAVQAPRWEDFRPDLKGKLPGFP